MAFLPEWAALSDRLAETRDGRNIEVTKEEFEIFKTREFQDYHGQRWSLEQSQPTFDRDDARALFSVLMQAARQMAKKWGFTIKQWPEK